MIPKLLFLDIETSGLYPEGGAVILSIGAITDTGDEYYRLILPTMKEWEKASPEALRVNGLTYGQLSREGKEFTVIRDEFVGWLRAQEIQRSKALIVGQNPEFDLRFLIFYMSNELISANVPTSPLVDVRDVYTRLSDRGLVPFLGFRSGHNISKTLGVEEEPMPHHALEGAKVIMRNYMALYQLDQRLVGDMAKNLFRMSIRG